MIMTCCSPYESCSFRDGEWPYTHDDDDLLSSGQASPVIDPRTPKAFIALSLDGSKSPSSSMFTQSQPLSAATQLPKGSMNPTIDDAEYEQKVTEFMKKKPWGSRLQPARPASWSDIHSARLGVENESLELDDGKSDAVDTDQSTRAPSPALRHRHHQRHHTVLGGHIHDEPGTMSDDYSDHGRESRVGTKRRPRTPRRRSYHDLASLQGRDVLAIDRMKIDVDLAGQLLVMSRREAHLLKVIMTMKVRSSSFTKRA